MARESLVHQTSQQLLNEQDSSHQIDLDEDHEVIVNKNVISLMRASMPPEPGLNSTSVTSNVMMEKLVSLQAAFDAYRLEASQLEQDLEDQLSSIKTELAATQTRLAQIQTEKDQTRIQKEEIEEEMKCLQDHLMQEVKAKKEVEDEQGKQKRDIETAFLQVIKDTCQAHKKSLLLQTRVN